MDRRKFLNGMTAAALGLSGAAKADAAFNSAILGSSRAAAPVSREVMCRIIGVGDRGCAAVQELARTPVVPGHVAMQTEFACVDSGHDSLDYLDAANAARGGHHQRIKTLSLCPISVGSSVEQARTVAWQKRTELCALMHDANLVFLVAGLGGGVDSGVPPLMAAWAREAHALVVAAAIMPLEWTGEQRVTRAQTALLQLQQAADWVVPFSSDQLAQTLGDDVTMSQFFTEQDQQISTCLRRVLAFNARLA